jgi:FkbM family methyltransferase
MSIFNRNDYILKDSPLKELLLKLFKYNDKLIILDIGGCEGEESIRYSRIFSKSKIYIFEPLPKNITIINENIIKFKVDNVFLQPFAVSDQNGVATFHISSGHPEHESKDLDWDFGNKSSSLLPPQEHNNLDWLSFKETIEVKTITLDSFCEENNVSKIDFIHMDVQGAELKVMLGAKKVTKNIKAIWLEVADIELYKNQPLRFDIEKFMFENNFKLAKTDMEGMVGDQLYLNKRYFKVFNFFSKQFYLKINK